MKTPAFVTTLLILCSLFLANETYSQSKQEKAKTEQKKTIPPPGGDAGPGACGSMPGSALRGHVVPNRLATRRRRNGYCTVPARGAGDRRGRQAPGRPTRAAVGATPAVGRWDAFEKEEARTEYFRAAGRMMSDADAPKSIVKQGLSEYFIFTIPGEETVRNG